MSDSYQKYMDDLHSIFVKRFMETYRQASSKRRRQVLPFLQAIFRRWFYSALIEETPFTPANIVASMDEQRNQSTGSVLRPHSKSKFTNIKIDYIKYSLEDHPVASDLRKLIDYCSPTVDLSPEGGFSDLQSVELGDMLTLNDPHYASFLLEVAITMKFFTKMPSVYVNRMEVSANRTEILNSSDREILQEIVENAILIASKALRQFIPMHETLFSDRFIRGLLAEPMETDEIFSKVYEVAGFTLEDLMDIGFDDGPAEIDEATEILIAGSFFLGIMLDKFFYTPFGHYLKLIRPMYVLPFEFDEVESFIDNCDDDEMLYSAFFAPCSSYTLTPLGLELFEVDPNENNYLDIEKVMPFSKVKESLFDNPQMLEFFYNDVLRIEPAAGFHGLNFPPVGVVYNFLVTQETDKRKWMTVQIPAQMTLEDLFDEIAEGFDLIDGEEYSFFHDKVENRFTEYVSPSLQKKSRKTAEIPLSELDFDHKQNMLLVVYNQEDDFYTRAERFAMKKTGESPRERGMPYPMTTELSKSLKAFKLTRTLR